MAPAVHAEGMAAATVVVFDVNETLSDLAPMASRFADVGLPAHTAPTWFASVLRDGFALAASGSQSAFASIAEGVLRGLLASHALERDPDAAVQHVVSGFTSLQVHPDVRPGISGLARIGLRLVTLTNGATSVAEALLGGADLRDSFELLLSVEHAGVWKPAPGSYAYAARRCEVVPAEMLLVAVHPWDIDGAARAGLQTAWVNRTAAPYPPYFTAPDRTVTGVDDLARQLGADTR
ncbi:MAG: haloacid dehalogenase type II [Mycobacteriales bacterium]